MNPRTVIKVHPKKTKDLLAGLAPRVAHVAVVDSTQAEVIMAIILHQYVVSERNHPGLRIPLATVPRARNKRALTTI